MAEYLYVVEPATAAVPAKITAARLAWPEGDRRWRVQVMRSKGWQDVLEDGTRGQAERIAAEARRQMQ